METKHIYLLMQIRCMYSVGGHEIMKLYTRNNMASSKECQDFTHSNNFEVCRDPHQIFKYFSC